MLRAGQTFAQAQAHGPDVLGAVAQIGVIHAPEQGAEFFHRMIQGPGGADFLVFNARQSCVQQFGITGQLHLGRDDIAVFGQIFGHVAHGFFQGCAHTGRRGAQGVPLRFHLVGADAAFFAHAHVVHEANGTYAYAGRHRRAE